ncbi:MAG: GAF domain-containing protein [Myxococcota bacterium]
MRFRVTVTPHPPKDVDAGHWMAALAEVVLAHAPEASLSRLATEVLPNGTVLVRDADSGARYIVQPLADHVPDDYVVTAPIDEDTYEAFRPASLRDEIEEIHRAPTPERAVRRTLEAMGALVPCECAWVLLLEADERLRFAACTATPRGKLSGTWLPAGTGVAADAIARKATVAVRDAAKDPRVWRELEARAGVRPRSLLCVPVAGVGCLEFVNGPDRDGFGATHVADAEALAQALARRLLAGA